MAHARFMSMLHGPRYRSLLTAHNGELLNALEHIATKILRLEPESHDQVSFDADHFKANRERRLREVATTAVERVFAPPGGLIPSRR